MRNWIFRLSPELQFWGYESGNLLAAVAGAGGFIAFYAGVATIAADDQDSLFERATALLTQFPDAAVTIGLALIVLWSLILGAIVKRAGADGATRCIDRVAATFSIALILATLVLGASWITISAVFFVSGSALLRQCFESPVFLKLGGLLICGGGLCLAGAGLDVSLAAHTIWVAGLTAVSGFFVAGAGLMTYRGGQFECDAAKQSASTGRRQPAFFHPAGPAARTLEATLDRPVRALVEAVVLPSLFWIPGSTKSDFPFLTSMWARLPWRFLTAVAALATGSVEGLTFAAANLMWAIGDIAIGALDWDRAQRSSRAVAGEVQAG